MSDNEGADRAAIEKAWDLAVANSKAVPYSEEWYNDVTSPDVKARIDLQVPYEWSHIICKCYAPNSDYKKPCKNCGKMPRWFIQCSCRGCGQHYYWGFDHHKRNADKFKYCFDCLVARYGQVETDIAPPEWAHARTARPIAEVLNFDFNFDMEF